MTNKKIWAAALILFFLAAVAGGYFFLRNFRITEKVASTSGPHQDSVENTEDLLTLRIYYPYETGLQMAEKKVQRKTGQTAIAEAVIEEFFRGRGNDKNGKGPLIPGNVKLLGLYRDAGQILYVDLSDEFRRNFQGDALAEYLLLKGIYESLVSNLQELHDVKLLIEGKEAETLGGHFYLKYTLKNTVSPEYKGDIKVGNE